MLSFILILVFGLLVAFFAGQNTAPVAINFPNYQLPAVPLYVIIVSSMLIGFIISWLVSLIDGLFTAFVLQGKDSAIRNSQKRASRLEEKIHDLEVENARLKGENKEPIVVEHEEQRDIRPSFFGRFRHIT